VLPNGIEPDEYAVDRNKARKIVRRSWPQIGDSAYVLFLGRLHPKKRVDLLLEAFLEGAPRDFKLVVAGPDEGNLWEPLAARSLRDPDATRRVLRLGTVGGADKVALLAAAALFALPSEHENFGVAALEALGAGTPVLLSPHVDLAETALAADVGFTAPLLVEAWRDSFAEILSDNEGLKWKSEQRRQWVRENCAWSYIARELSQQYELVIANFASEKPNTCPPRGAASCLGDRR
jgi:glycosyltransferase involved in cell wall biosynthesis